MLPRNLPEIWQLKKSSDKNFADDPKDLHVSIAGPSATLTGMRTVIGRNPPSDTLASCDDSIQIIRDLYAYSDNVRWHMHARSRIIG